MVGFMIILIAYPDANNILVPRVCVVHVYWPDESNGVQLDHTKIIYKDKNICIFL